MIVMWDSIYVSEVGSVASSSGQAVAGYVAGNWPDYGAMAAAFPNDRHLSIAPQADNDADCLDVETGDAHPSQAPAWFVRQRRRGVWRPCFYANASTMPQVRAYLRGIPRDAYRLWVADWTYSPHIPGGYDACQWTDRAYGRNLDESLCLDSFFPQSDPPPPPPPPPEEIMAIAAATNVDGRLEVFVEAQDGSVWHTYQEYADGTRNVTGWSGAEANKTAARLTPLAPPPGK